MTLYIRILKILKHYPLSLIIIGIILYLSLANFSGVELTDITNLDKVAHFCMYAGFCSVLWFEYHISHKRTNKTRIFWGAIIAPIVFSATIEVIQATLAEGRSGDWYDLLFNILGTLFASVLGIFVIRPIAEKYSFKKRAKKENKNSFVG